jgi:hypothetical protein
VNFPPVGSFVRVTWQDIEFSDDWADMGEALSRTVEITAGMFRGVSPDGKVRICTTVSVKIDDYKADSKHGEIAIPQGCILLIERLMAEPVTEQSESETKQPGLAVTRKR